ncbi:MAG: hypothetical protein LN568_00760 [Rickettsia endosymbiont of Pseudomimeciton antennatum]|nr:hypothetical protein [Rickettsia endosymbiont of Pseudomimeciton antennatum]MCC8397918.1 hypothetical protein [Rickettsia endosymbiont of Labidopullus appendiculatus]
MGYCYLGDIEFSSIRFIFYKESGRLYLATTAHVTSEEIIISLHSIVNNKLDYLYAITIMTENPRDSELFEMIFKQHIEEHKLNDAFRLRIFSD